jgi:hypothetical protein
MAATLLSLALAVWPVGVGAASPTPSFDATCALGGATVATWSHVGIDWVSYTWNNGGIVNVGTAQFDENPKAKHGKSSAATPGAALTVTIQLYFPPFGSGGEHDITIDCT